MHFEVRRVGMYNAPQSGTHFLPAPLISLNVRGLTRYRCPGFDQQRPGPFILLGYQGMRVDFEYGNERENWVIMLETDALRASSRPGWVAVRSGASSVELPVLTPLPPEQVTGWLLEFENLHRAFLEPIPRNALRLRAGVMNVLRYLIDSMDPPAETDPAGRLRRLIDEDAEFAQSLEELSGHCGFSPDYLRRLFERRYHMLPIEYRNRRRMARAMELVTNSTLSLKEIAAGTGFNHASHFSLMFRKTFGMTARAAVAAFRR